MSLIDGLRSDFTKQTRDRGDSYFRSKRVSLKREVAAGAILAVRGDTDDYTVCMDWEDAAAGTLLAACTCPHFDDGFLCKHIWASLRFLGQRNSGLIRENLELIPTDPYDLNIELMQRKVQGTTPGKSLPAKNGVKSRVHELIQKSLQQQSKREDAPAGGGANWKDALSNLITGATTTQPGTPSQASRLQYAPEIYYILNVDLSAERSHIVIETFWSPVGHRNPEPQRFTFRIYDIGTSWKEADQRLLRILLNTTRESGRYQLNTAYSGQSQFTLSVDDFLTIAPQLCETGHFRWRLAQGQSLLDSRLMHWDGGVPYELGIQAQPQKKSGWELQAFLYRGDERQSVPGMIALMMKRLVLFADGRLAVGRFHEHAHWLDLFFEKSTLKIPATGRTDLLNTLWALPGLPTLEFPPELQVATREVVPRPVMRLKPYEFDRKHLQAELAFLYEDQDIAHAASQKFLPTEDVAVAIARNPELEGLAAKQLIEFGCQNQFSRQLGREIRMLPAANLLETVARLLDNGWLVEGEQGLLRRSSGHSVAVTSGVDWFDLDTVLQFDDQQVQLPKLLAALRHGQQFVALGDGSQGIIPEEWFGRFGSLADLGEAQADGTVRFRTSQALLLDALLESQTNVQFDETFLAFRKKLQDFSGIESAREPQSFTGELRPYQRDGLGWMQFLRDFRFGGCLADDMGLGKTVQVLALLEARRLEFSQQTTDEPHRPSLAIVPKSLIFNWCDEAAKFSPQLRILNYTGKERKLTSPDLNSYDLIITTYGTLRMDVIELKDIPFDYIILDEATAIKNSDSQSAKSCRLLQARYRLAMSGTPIENHLGELWSLFEFLNPGLLGHSTTFQQLARQAATDPESRKFLAKAIAPYVLRRTKSQVLKELPEKTEQTIYCELPPKQRKEYNQLRDHYRTLLAGKIEEQGLKKSKIHVLEALLRLRQAACHPGLIDKKRVGQTSAKIDTLIEQIENVVKDGHKALIFSQFTSFLDIVRKQLDKRKLRYEYLDGKTTNRKRVVERFQTDSECPLFLISLKAGGHGLNLTAADYVFILDPWWNPAVEAQAVDRAHRMGQTQSVFAYRIIARDTVEEKVLQLQQGKKELADAIITANDSLLKSLTAEDLSMLLS